MRIATIWRLGIKELWGLLRSPALLVLIAAVFSIQVYASAVATPFSLNKAPISIVDEDVSPLSARVASAFYLPYFNPPRAITLTEMNRRMDEGTDTFALVIPPHFQRDLLAGSEPTMQLNVDATRMTQAFTGAGYVQAIVAGEVAEFLQRYRAVTTPPVELILRARFNPELNLGWFSGLMEVVNNIALLSVILAGAALIRERERGTIDHLLVMPVKPVEIVLGKIWPMAMVVLVAACLSITVVVQTWLAIPVAGSLWLFVLGMALQLFATTSLGILLATIAGSMPQFGLLLMLVLFPLQILAGGLTPIENMPGGLRQLMALAPDTHFVSLSQAIMFRGAGLEVIWPELLSLLAIGLAFFAISL
ncbi:ABC transporter permease [Aurantimonas endophytica]|uniref:ABC-2 type transport system permease protein n=1 Tax=Aurantimonas endophytica TaxID=1522175 RepID=A0A7W6HHR8_9HYPH|nr:ABC transporter permease [Aurantimonas endophytica]MBB4005172.1 ABC-2 type transport system permease protein [Aurantimonas endophytica]MCO6406165.1 ABC transporter permease [Aurantimonas endophytica]